MKEDYQKALKKSTLFFLLNPAPFNWKSYQKQKGPGTSDQSLFRLQNKFTKISSLVSSHQVWWCNIKQFLSYSKNYTCRFMQANSWHHKLFQSHFSFRISKVWKRRGLQKFEHLENKNSFFRWNKKHFSYFFKGYHLAKK